MKRITILLACLLLFGLLVMAQDIQITGKVTSADDGNGLPGVSVVVKGTTSGATTTIDGDFSILAPSDATLLFRFIGMKSQEIAVGGQTTLNVIMEMESTDLEAVVVTALGISKEKKGLGYSIQKVDSEDIKNSQNTNIINSIGGRVAGVQVTNSSGAAGSGSYMVIRGQASLTRSNSPLFVVDGVPIDNSQNYSGNPDNVKNNLNDGVAYSNRAMDINPDDIASVSVLKGGAATALYGLRAANGAVVITTKKGEATAKGKVNVEVNLSFTFDKASKLPELQNKYTQGYNGEWAPPSPGMSLSWGALGSEMAWDGDKSFKWDKNGALVPKDAANADKAFIPYDNSGTFFENGFSSNASVSISGGSEKSTFYASISRTSTDGVIPRNTFSKTGFKITGESKVWDNFSIFGSANYINSGGDRIQQGSNVSGIMLGLLRTPISFDNANGNLDPVNTLDSYELPNGFQRNFRAGAGYDNPYWSINKNILHDDVNRLIAHMGFRWTALSWISLQYRLGTDFYSDQRHYYFGIHSRQFPKGQVSQDEQFNHDINSDLLINLSKKFGDFDLRATIGHNMYSTYYQQVYVQGDKLTIPDFYHLSNASDFLQRNSINEKRTAAFFGDFGASWNRMVYVNLTGRQEWSTSMPKESNSFFYPSTSLSLILTELEPLKDNSILSFAKLRASYSMNAYDATIYSVKDVFIVPAYADGWTNGVSFPFEASPGSTFNDVAPNKYIVPEKLQSTELGTELFFFNNRLTIDFTYYDNLSKDLLLNVPTSGAQGYLSMYMNAGEMVNKGIELSVGVKALNMSNFTWDILVNYTKNKNKVIKLASGVDNVNLGGFEGAQVRAVAGQPYGNIYGSSWLRFDANGDKKAQPEEPVIIISDPNQRNYGYPEKSSEEIIVGNNQPDWLMGITNSFTIYKNLTLSALIDIRKGGDIWNGTRGALNAFGMSKETEYRETATKVFDGYKGYWDENRVLVNTGEKNNISSRLDQGWYGDGEGNLFNGAGEQFIENGGWIRLKELTVSYNFTNLFKETFLRKGASVYFTGRNLWLSTNYQGVDPETSLYGADNAQGMDFFNMPGTKSYIFGLRVAF